MTYKLGSLFDGSGGFPLASTLCGITPAWSSEVEPYPIAVTRSRFPDMKHLGDISKINGADVEPVDIITFGSPCQDLSVAGKRAGLKHEANGDDETTRSGLFIEAVRIIKEMRGATNGKYPRFALWENVPGAFSSNKGEDFRVVLEELIKVVEPTAVMPDVPKNGWPYADSYCGDGWSLAYRVFDAQFWGVPQRRRRIHLVVDFGGQCAREVLFEREGVRGYFAQSGTQGQAAAGDAENCSGADDRERDSCVAFSFDSLASNSMKSKNPHSGCRQVEVAKTLDTTDPNPCKNQGGIAIVEPVVDQNILDDQGGSQTLRAGVTPAIVECVDFGRTSDRIYINPKTSVTLSAQGGGMGAKTGRYCLPVYCLQGNGIDRADTAGCNGKGWKEDTCYTLNTIDRPAVAYLASRKPTAEEMNTPIVFDKEVYQSGQNATGGHYIAEGGPAPTLRTTGHPPGCCYGVDCRNFTETPELYPTLQAKPNGGQSLNYSGALRTQYIVRRLTPTECARLQGFADRWGDIDHKDDFSDEEYRFWLDARNTHANINGKATKEYTKEQMLKWYNSLHTDSSEYKMWGNGIALPPALYCMQGICDALDSEKPAEQPEAQPTQRLAIDIPALVAQLRATVSVSKRKMLDDAADVIEMLAGAGS